VKFFEQNGFYLLREGGNHSIYTNGLKVIRFVFQKREKNLRFFDVTYSPPIPL
jgi:predicted RNA binding protein YcfA (HicA-like mRNA interferase family)